MTVKDIIRARLLAYSEWLVSQGYIDIGYIMPPTLNEIVDCYIKNEMSNAFKTHDDER